MRLTSLFTFFIFLGGQTVFGLDTTGLSGTEKKKLETSEQYNLTNDYANLLKGSAATYLARARNANRMVLNAQKAGAKFAADASKSMKSAKASVGNKEDKKEPSENSINPEDMKKLQEEMTNYKIADNQAEADNVAKEDQTNLGNYNTQTNDQTNSIEARTGEKNVSQGVNDATNAANAKDAQDKGQKDQGNQKGSQGTMLMALGATLIAAGVAMMAIPGLQAKAAALLKEGGAKLLMGALLVGGALMLLMAFMQSKAKQAATNAGNAIKADNAYAQTLCDRDRLKKIESNQQSVSNSYCNDFTNVNSGNDLATSSVRTPLLTPIGDAAASEFASDIGVNKATVIAEALKKDGDISSLLQGKGFENYLKKHVPDEKLREMMMKTPNYKSNNPGKTSLKTLASSTQSLGNQFFDSFLGDSSLRTQAKDEFKKYVEETILGDKDIRGTGMSAVQAEAGGMHGVLGLTDSALSQTFGDYAALVDSKGVGEEVFAANSIARGPTGTIDPELGVIGSLFARIRQRINSTFYTKQRMTKEQNQEFIKKLKEEEP